MTDQTCDDRPKRARRNNTHFDLQAPKGGAVKHATVLQTRRLRDGRQLIEVTCGHCDSKHWLLTDGTTLAYCLTHNLPMFIDGLGDIVRRTA